MLVSPKAADGLSKMLQTLGRYYVPYFNHHYKRTGTLWEGRYKSTLINSEQYLFSCMRYIELNPIRAAMVEHPSEYPWSSYHCNASGEDNSLITHLPEYKRIGSSLEECQKNYQALFLYPLDKKTITDIREAANKSRVLGDAKFKAAVEQQLARRVSPVAKGGDRKSRKYHEIMTNIN